MQFVPWRNKLAGVLPPDKVMLVTVTTAIPLPWILGRCNDQLIWPIFQCPYINTVELPDGRLGRTRTADPQFRKPCALPLSYSPTGERQLFGEGRDVK